MWALWWSKAAKAVKIVFQGGEAAMLRVRRGRNFAGAAVNARE